jgi:Na+-translocating ferredoxin:NAD+ oxidoreductase RnfD subunit
MESIGIIIAALLTLMVFSYIFGDNVLFKLAMHIFVGVALGYAITIVWYQVFAQISPKDMWQVVPALLLCLLLILKIVPTQSEVAGILGGITLAFVLGVGVALAIGGALIGTLVPQILSTAGISLNPNHYQQGPNSAGLVDWLNNIIIVLGTVGTFFTSPLRYVPQVH